MIAVSPHGSAAAENAVDGAGHANREALKPAHEGGVLVSLDKEVEVIGLDAELQETKTPA